MRRHFDAVDPTRSHARAGVQCVFAILLALGILALTPHWPAFIVWTCYWPVIISRGVLSGPGTVFRELRTTGAIILLHGAAIVVGTLTPVGNDWFFPIVGAIGFLAGMGIAFGNVGKMVASTSLIAFALASAEGGNIGVVVDRLYAGSFGIIASVIVLILGHVIGHRAGLAEFRGARPAIPPFHLFPSVDKGTVLHAARLAVTALSAAAVATLMGIDHPAWVILTIAAILQRRLGETMKRGAHRFAGTLIGALIGWAIASAVGPDNAIWLLLLAPFVLVAVFIFVPANYIVGIALVTTFILFVYAVMGNALTASAFERLFDTLVAAVIGVVVSIVLIPESAVVGLRRAVIDFLRHAAVEYPRALFGADDRNPADADRPANAFKSAARLAAKEISLAEWEAIPGRPIVGLRQELRRLVTAIYRHIERLSNLTQGAQNEMSPEQELLLRNEAEAVQGLFRQLEAHFVHRRPPEAKVVADASALLAAARKASLPYAEARIPLIEALVDLLELLGRRYQGVTTAGEEAPIGDRPDARPGY